MATPVGQPLDPKCRRQPPGMMPAGCGGLVKTVKASPGGETDATINNIHGNYIRSNRQQLPTLCLPRC